MRTPLAVLLGFLLASIAPLPHAPFHAIAADRPCGTIGKPFVRSTLYFGLSRPAGSITDEEWTAFLRDEVTPRFPSGLTVWEADGQWRRPDQTIAHEKAKVLLLVHDTGAASKRAVNDLIVRYKDRFQQESVLWETANVCAAF